MLARPTAEIRLNQALRDFSWAPCGRFSGAWKQASVGPFVSILTPEFEYNPSERSGVMAPAGIISQPFFGVEYL
jgi:hypothetical protein